ncbi:MAG: hypothetical protein ACREQI_00245 [Candidatus Binataceae bacterium]
MGSEVLEAKIIKMNPPNNVTQAPSYEDVVKTYGLEVLKPGGDLQITTTGGLERTSDGGLKFGDDRFNAMFRLVQRWRFNSPTLMVLFDSDVHARAQKQRSNEQRNRMNFAAQDANFVREFHALNDEIGASEFGCAAYAGAIMVVLSNLLLRFGNDLKATDEDWKKSDPLVGGYSVGSVIRAAANSFRHHDEWARTNPPTPQQLPSIEVIASTLNEPTTRIRSNACPEVIQALSGGSYDQLNRNFFTFANNMVARRKKQGGA